MEEHTPAAADHAEPAKKRARRCSLGLPAGIGMRGKKYQARLCYVPTDCKAKEQRHIGSFDTCEEAVAALAEAQHKRKKENRTQGRDVATANFFLCGTI